MIKVWYLDTSDYDAGMMLGVFRTKRSAEAAAKAYNKHPHHHKGFFDAHVEEGYIFSSVKEFMKSVTG